MADNKVLIEFQIVQKGQNISVIQKETDKLRKTQDQTADSQKNLSKQQQIGYGRQKQGLVQTANSTKNFSKLAQTINGGGGGTSLVGAYATLAANIFAATAAFNALSRAAEFQQLSQGLELIGAQSGRSLGLLAQNLREATDNALTLEQASRGAALGVSGGFGSRELEGLAKIAKGASLALGRDLADAFDRLTRGAIKLEPEILDELGIMVRLDDAVEAYAASLGKPATALSQLERRQAFMNAILEQGELKFGEIADAVDPTPYQRLGAAFGDLTKDFFTFINETAGLNAVVEFLADNVLALVGVLITFGSTIATQMVPALGNQAAAARAAAEAASEMAIASVEAADDILESSRAAFLAFEGGAGNFKLIQEQAKRGTGETINFQKALTSLRRSEAARQAQLDANNVKDRAAAELKQQDLRKQILLTEQLQLAETNRAAAQIAANTAIASANLATRQADNLEDFTTGQVGLSAALGAASANVATYFKDLDDINPATTRLGKANNFLKKTFMQLGAQLKVLVAGFAKFLPLIGTAIIVLGVLAAVLRQVFFPKEVQEYNEQFKKLETVLEGIEDKSKEYQKAISGALPPAIAQQREYEILGNVITEINTELQETIRLQKEAFERSGRRTGFGEGFGERGIIKRGNLQDDMSGSLLLDLRTVFVEDAEDVLQELPDLVGTSLKLAEQVITSQDFDKTLANLFKIDDTAEYKSFLQLLEFEPYEKFLLESKDLNIAELFTIDSSTEEGNERLLAFLERLGVEIDKTQKKFGGLAGVTTSFRNTLQEVEKSSSQFIQKFFPKTSVSVLLTNLKALETEIKAVADASGILDKTTAEEIGKLLTQAGPQVRKLLGPIIDEQILQVLKLQREFAEMTVLEKERDDNNNGIADGLEKQAEISKLLVNIGQEGGATFEENLKTVTLIQQQEVLRKQNLKEISTLQKTITQGTKFSTLATIALFDLERRRFDLNKADRTNRLNFQATELEIGMRIAEDDSNRLQVIEALKKKRDELVATGGDENKIAGINLVLAEEENAVLEERLRLAAQAFRVDEARAKLNLETLKLEERRNTAAAALSKILIERENRLAGGTGQLSGFQAAVEAKKAEEDRLDIAKRRVEAEKKLIVAQNSIIFSQFQVIARTQIAAGKVKEAAETMQILRDIVDITRDAVNTVDIEYDTLVAGLGDAIDKEFSKVFGRDGPILTSLDQTLLATAQGVQAGTDPTLSPEEAQAERVNVALQIMRKSFDDFGKQMEDMFGEDGKVIAALSRLASTITDIALSIPSAFKQIDDAFNAEDGFFTEFKNENPEQVKSIKGLMRFAAVMQSVSAVISGFQQALAADAERRTGLIDDQIAAEKKLDGKSKESIAKINAMEKKKEAIQRKQFETNKKMQIANAIISTAAAAASTYASISAIPGVGPFLAPAMAAAIIALGMAQIAIIRKTQFSGGGSAMEAPANTSLSIGQRSNSVDVSQSATAGELNYLRGGATTGGDLGGAGGVMGRRGYADGGEGIVVGERGPEVITPAAPIDITPNFALGGGTQNVNFTINAVDAAGVEDVLTNQRGNIIRMIREAANENGERFLETIDTQAYGSKS